MQRYYILSLRKCEWRALRDAVATASGIVDNPTWYLDVTAELDSILKCMFSQPEDAVFSETVPDYAVEVFNNALDIAFKHNKINSSSYKLLTKLIKISTK